ncbi:hypothetical protein Xcel_1326 [Xylanimonas cellulosilytica DSM 15894]|uniref:Nitroreductase family deazaflavin-dependent oxidoreductase n=1 Tax=Xylanimonas cellulosilytica (strain DSM 15894 / JCM 12276 / CECT 5975 / KCTC 9989 / LMG 20990 / NBRC 107835 / XIL07) TaxID=446471 RepID=D1BRA2_XYLCX|nr:nitroreductase family deazaflavin-dependent oxidoreductase [Xylanimonas cellulosilytica]ACZ30357.1 hypothetical protein Xcel_1326 [Xylanimonas cellulosilytica DSM 15894]
MTVGGRIKAAWLQVLKHGLNRFTLRAAHAGRGPFVLMEHVGRRSGRTFETPLIVARTDGGFVVELTYGTQVQWYRNVLAAGGGTIVRGARRWRVGAPQLLDPQAGRAAFTAPARLALRVLRRREFRFLPDAPPPPEL